jgi:hypothetical protein
MKYILSLLAMFIVSFSCIAAAESTVTVENLRIDNGYIVNFTAMNARFEGILSSTVTSSFHDGMKLDVVSSSVLEKDEFGRYRMTATFLIPETQEEIELTSKWMGGDVFVQDVTKSENQLQWASHTEWVSDKPGYGPGMPITVSQVTSWKINFTLQDGTSYIADYQFSPGRYYNRGGPPGNIFFDRDSRKGGAADVNIISTGDTIELVAEWPGDEAMKKNYQSNFLIKDVTKNTEFNATGETHYIEGFGKK